MTAPDDDYGPPDRLREAARVLREWAEAATSSTPTPSAEPPSPPERKRAYK